MLDLEPIKARESADDVPALIAEVERLRRDLWNTLEYSRLTICYWQNKHAMAEREVMLEQVRRLRRGNPYPIDVGLSVPSHEAEQGPPAPPSTSAPFYQEDAARWHAATESAVQSIVGEWIAADEREATSGSTPPHQPQ